MEGEFVALSAVTSGVKDVRAALDAARERLKYEGRGTILFVDEVHRFNKASRTPSFRPSKRASWTSSGQRPRTLPFEVIAPLLSRSRVLRLQPLSEGDLASLLGRGQQALGLEVSPEARPYLLQLSGGDGRRLLNALEAAAAAASSGRVEVADVEGAVGEKSLRYGREEHYDVVSAFIKSVRGGEPDAALHYLARMIEAGEDPVFIARRLVILASEDIGNADPDGLPLAVAAAQAVQLVGMPEGSHPARPGHDLPRLRLQVQRLLRRYQQGPRRHPPRSRSRDTHAPAQRRDRAYARRRVRGELSLRSR
jgi:putative ATPase